MERKLGLDGSWGYGHSRISILRERKRVLSVSFTHPQARTQQEDGNCRPTRNPDLEPNVPTP